VLGVEEEDVKDCCYRMISLYSNKKVCSHYLDTFPYF
jgi:hypothetical protein